MSASAALLEGSVGLNLISSIDLVQLQSKLLLIVSAILASGGDSIEEKSIVDNAMHVWTSCILFEPSLFAAFKAMDAYQHPDIKSAGDFIMTGLLYSPVEKIRSTFRDVFSAIASRCSDENSLDFSISLLSSNFSKISEYPCRQFFSCFNDIVDVYFRSECESSSFDPENLLS